MGNAVINKSVIYRYGLARLHPLLAHAMRLREANSVTAMVTPLAMHFPVETLTIKVSPLKLQSKGNKLMRGAVRLLEARCPLWRLAGQRL